MQNALVAISEKALFDGTPHVERFFLRFSSVEKEHRKQKRAYALPTKGEQWKRITSRFYTHCNTGHCENAEAIIADMYAWEKQYLWEQLSLIASI